VHSQTYSNPEVHSRLPQGVKNGLRPTLSCKQESAQTYWAVKLQLSKFSYDRPCRPQVSRLFSALLQLVNNGNVVLLRGSAAADDSVADGGPGQPFGGPRQRFELRLASLHRPHHQFDDYRAPSFLLSKVHTFCPSQEWLNANHEQRCAAMSCTTVTLSRQLCTAVPEILVR
jgi:hypothetical protein